MKNIKSKSAFSMIELVFVIVIIGILAAVAIPKLAASRDDAEITKASVVIASVRNALSMERQKRILRGEFKALTAVGDSTNVFGNFYDVDGDTGTNVLEYPVPSEAKRHHWKYDSRTLQWYAFCLNDTCYANGDAIWFVVRDGKFECIQEPGYGDCSMLGVQGIPR